MEVSVVARGEHLGAIRKNGLRLFLSPKGELQARVRATDTPQKLGPQDIVILALKSHQVTAALSGVKALLGPETAVTPPTTGIPYWYVQGLKGPLETHQIERLDPQGLQWQAMAPECVLGCVYWVAAEVKAPGVIHHDGRLSRFPMGRTARASCASPLRLRAARYQSG